MIRFLPALFAVCLGAFATLGFAPVRLPSAFLVSLIGLIYLLRHEVVGRQTRQFVVVLAGYAASLFGIGTWWLNAVSPAAWFALWLAHVLLFAVLGWVLSGVMQLRWWPVWAAAVWTGVEMLRGLVPFKGFPWLRLSHTALDTPIEGVVRWIGLNATTLVLVLLAGLVVAAIETRSIAKATAVVGTLLVMALAPTGLAGGSGDTLRVAAVQGNTPGPFGTWRSGDILDLHVAETARLAEPVDLILWPENASDLDVFSDRYASRLVSTAAQAAGAPILVGAILDGPTADSALNASVPVTPQDGPRQDIYVKQAVVPYGEFVPFRRLLGDLVPRFDREIPRDMISGTEPGVISIAGTSVGTVICWDVAHDRVVHTSVANGASFIAVQTSNATFADFGRGVQPQQQWDISRLRAIETGRWVIVASTNGISGVIDPHGRIIEQLPTRESGTVVATIDLASGETWATRLSLAVSWLIGAGALAGLIGCIVAKRKERA